ncbi:type II toxin-antitoxin system RelE/ParE family toxin [Nitratifractor sp.]|uniref:type II toxin-antitoxin system RelE/ParE family toxin n=1 Tax=Nitratifractor sp. TaxID=2268144 RepID=UPI0025E1C8AC|nr:type II toxin-antitoxin system RelE/ParE family toxin [Nitratifractor sp.]
MTIKIREEAEEDLRQAIRFYEAQKGGLGSYFFDSLLSDIESLLIYAGIHQKFFGFHRLLSKRFPFAIYYRINDHTIEIYAVLDTRRDPKRHQERLSK